MRAKLGRSVPVSHALRRPADLYEKASNRRYLLDLLPHSVCSAVAIASGVESMSRTYGMTSHTSCRCKP